MKKLKNYIIEGLFNHDPKKAWAQEALLHELNKYHDKWSIDDDKKQLIFKAKIGDDLYFINCEKIKSYLDTSNCDTCVIDSNNITSIGLEFPKYIDFENKTIMPYDSTRISPLFDIRNGDNNPVITIKNLNLELMHFRRGDNLTFNVFGHYGSAKLMI